MRRSSKMENYILKTNYFGRFWTWLKRGLVLLSLILGVIYFELVYPGGLLWKGLFLLSFSLYIFLRPTDDLAVDKRYFYHFKRSIQPTFSRTVKYDIERIKSIKVGGIYSPQFEIMELLGTGFSNTIEITFVDNSSVTLNLPIYKKELVKIVLKIKELIKSKNTMGDD